MSLSMCSRTNYIKFISSTKLCRNFGIVSGSHDETMPKLRHSFGQCSAQTSCKLRWVLDKTSWKLRLRFFAKLRRNNSVSQQTWNQTSSKVRLGIGQTMPKFRQNSVTKFCRNSVQTPSKLRQGFWKRK